ncbi:protein TMEPAI-like [Anabas testudineus]|uniref:protein TMEPAI-like n=1 Tax=Anabas testudineus TaxID=64144 RepID=UPI000E460660|nr:protein TMEPAI-like [Anabas testudineus]
MYVKCEQLNLVDGVQEAAVMFVYKLERCKPDTAELEVVQITVILLMMTFMIVVIICLLSHYWLPALAFLSRLSHTQRDQATQSVVCGHLNRRLQPFMQQQLVCRLQPTYPYLQQEIVNLPPLICLSDREEFLPYKGPCRLQLHPSEPELELRRATVRAPPNRTVFDTDTTHFSLHSKRLQVPSSNSVTNNANARMEDSPPSYNEVMGDCHNSTPGGCQNDNRVPPTDNRSGRARSQTVFHAGSSGPDSATQPSSDLNS